MPRHIGLSWELGLMLNLSLTVEMKSNDQTRLEPETTQGRVIMYHGVARFNRPQFSSQRKEQCGFVEVIGGTTWLPMC